MGAIVGSEWGPLAALAGTWEGSEGLDVSFHNEEGTVGDTKYRERVELKPFGPVDNGAQQLYGLDYRMAAWRAGEDEPFHTEVGYWLWDAANEQLMRCFMVPRGSTLIAGGLVKADATRFSLQAQVGSETYGILSNEYLAAQARTVMYQVNIEVGDDTWSYDETTTVELTKMPGQPLAHTDANRLVRVS